jgi:hypothetical protein
VAASLKGSAKPFEVRDMIRKDRGPPRGRASIPSKMEDGITAKERENEEHKDELKVWTQIMGL